MDSQKSTKKKYLPPKINWSYSIALTVNKQNVILCFKMHFKTLSKYITNSKDLIFKFQNKFILFISMQLKPK